MAGRCYSPQKASTKEARGNNLLKAGIFLGRWLPGLNREIPSVNNCALSDAFEEILPDELPQGATFWLERGPRRCLGRICGAVEWAALSAGSCPRRPPRFLVENQHPRAPCERAAGTRISTADSTFPAHPGTSNPGCASASQLRTSVKAHSARLALGGPAVGEDHVDPPLTSLWNSCAPTRIQQNAGARVSSALTDCSSWACPHTRSHQGRRSYKIRCFRCRLHPPLALLGGLEGPGRRWLFLSRRRSQGWGGVERRVAPSPGLAPGSRRGPDPGWRVTSCPSPGDPDCVRSVDLDMRRQLSTPTTTLGPPTGARTPHPQAGVPLRARRFAQGGARSGANTSCPGDFPAGPLSLGLPFISPYLFPHLSPRGHLVPQLTPSRQPHSCFRTDFCLPLWEGEEQMSFRQLRHLQCTGFLAPCLPPPTTPHPLRFSGSPVLAFVLP